MHGRVLIVDDEPEMCRLIEADLGRRGFAVSWFVTAEQGFAALAKAPFDVALTDLRMPGVDGIELCRRIVANRPGLPVVVMTAFGSLETAIAAMRAGAYDFITKPIDLNLLAFALDRAIQHHALHQQVATLSEAVERTRRFDDLIGASPLMQRLYEQITCVADSEASVLVRGENGTGKELVARSIHRRGRRQGGPFVPVNCAAVPEAFLESELFGHVGGTSTDAQPNRKGLFIQAEGGTLLLDEIADLPLALQPKLLRVLEDRKLRSAGGEEETPVNVRVIALTNRDLETAIEEGRFREDLFFRINVVSIELPPLRTRGTDILLLTQHFLQNFAARDGKSVTGITDAVAERLMAYDWPGNVRELRNAIERAVALTRVNQITVEDLPEKIRSYRGSTILLSGQDPTELAPMEEVERRYILHVLKSVGGNRTLAARVLGLDRKTLYRKLLAYGTEGEAKAS